MQDAVGEGFHGHLEVLRLQSILRAVDQLSNAPFLVLLDAKHVQFDQIHDLAELYKEIGCQIILLATCVDLPSAV